MATRSPVCVDAIACEEGYALGWNISLIDPHALWEAAAARLSTSSGATHQDIEDTLGPREDPSIADCLIALLPTVSIPGCEATSVLCRCPDIANRTETGRLSSHVVYR